MQPRAITPSREQQISKRSGYWGGRILTEAVVRAADGLGSATGSAKTNGLEFVLMLLQYPRKATAYRDGGAGKTDRGAQVLDDNAQETQDSGCRGSTSSSSTLAALQRASSARRRRGIVGHGCGGSKNSERRDDCDCGEHYVWIVFGMC